MVDASMLMLLKIFVLTELKVIQSCLRNVQVHSGSQANQRTVFLALLKPGDTIMGMSLAAKGGHLTHGAPPNDQASGSTPFNME